MKAYNPSIEHLRFIFAVMVVFIHTYGRGGVSGEALVEGSLVTDVQGFFSHTLASVAVPGFFLLSGYLFFVHMQVWSWRGYEQSLRRRLITLLMPFVVWNVLKLITLIIPAMMANGWEGVAQVCHTYGGWRMWWDGNPDYPAPVLLATWFLRDLMVFCLLAPLVHWLVRKGAFALFALLVCCSLFGWWPTERVCSAHHLALFVLGATFSIRGRDMFACFSKFMALSYLVGVLALVARVWYPCTLTSLLFILSGTVAICNFVCSHEPMFTRLLPTRYTQASMFIYLGHSLLVLSGVSWLLAHCVSFSGYVWMLLRYFMAPPLTIAILVILYQFLRKHLPIVLFVLLGRK